MRIFKNKPFARFARKARLSDAALREAIDRAGHGLIDADLGGGVIKQRIAREGGGKSGGFRTIIVFRAGRLSVFVHGFAKNEQDNIGRLQAIGGSTAGLRRRGACARDRSRRADGGEGR